MTTEEYMLDFYTDEQIGEILEWTMQIEDGHILKPIPVQRVVRYWSLKCSYEATQREALETHIELVKQACLILDLVRK
jgi:hypothetical protein